MLENNSKVQLNYYTSLGTANQRVDIVEKD